MKHLIFKNENAANGKCNALTAQHCPSPSGITTVYSKPRKHPTKKEWAVPVLKEERGNLPSNENAAMVELDDSWNVVDVVDEEV